MRPCDATRSPTSEASFAFYCRLWSSEAASPLAAARLSCIQGTRRLSPRCCDNISSSYTAIIGYAGFASTD